MSLLKPFNFLIKLSRRMGHFHENRDKYWLDRIGTREMVGYGYNGQPTYVDRIDYPFPAIRWKETTADIESLYEKQKGDWRLLSKNEKKTLYRANYCQIFAESEVPRTNWMKHIGQVLILISFALWYDIFVILYAYEELPESFQSSRQQAQLRRQIDLHMNPITGLASKWDYEKQEWKKNAFWFNPLENPFVKCDQTPKDDM